MPTLTIPILRRGETYLSLDIQQVAHLGTGEPAANVSFANAGLIKRDLQATSSSRNPLAKYRAADLFQMAREAGDLFLKETLPVGLEKVPQSPEDYIHSLAATSGLPHTLIRSNMERLHKVFQMVPTIFQGLSRGLDPAVLDAGQFSQSGVTVSYVPTTSSLGVILPSNSPAVNALWIPALAMKTPVTIKPGREEPWTPWRIIQAMIAAGFPKEAFSYYPTDHEGSSAIIRRSSRVMLFGGDSTVKQYESDPRVEVHGSGRSKILIGEDKIDDWNQYLDILLHSISANSGRSCINCSCIVVPRHGDAIAHALAKRLLDTVPRSATDPNAVLSGFANPQMANWINETVDEGLAEGGARDVSLELRKSPHYVEFEGMHFLLPTITRVQSISHPLGNTEFLFPYASVVEMPQGEMLEAIGKSLAVTAISEDQSWLSQLIRAPHIERLNIGAMPTNHIEWDQPHEGNLFEFLYQRRSIQIAAAA